MRGFERTSAGYAAELDAFERDVLAQVVADVAELLGERPTPLADRDGGGYFTLGSTSVGGADTWAPLDVSSDHLPTPDDRGVHRLLPDASDDAALAAEFRRLTEGELRRKKSNRLHALWDQLVQLPVEPGGAQLELIVPPERADDLAAALTDIRLVLADRLDIETDEDAEALYDELADADALARLDQELDAELAPSAGDLDGDGPPDVGGSSDPGESEKVMEIEARTVRTSLGTVYAALTWLQESLLEVMMADLDH